MTDPKLTATIPLTVPAEEGVGENRRTHSSLIMRRPRTRHVKAVVALLGADFARNLISAGEDEDASITGKDTVAEALALLTDRTRLDGLTEIMAELCGVSPEAIDDLDPADLIKVGRAMFDFFPAMSGLWSPST